MESAQSCLAFCNTVARGECSEAEAERRDLHCEQRLDIARMPGMTPGTDGFSDFFLGDRHTGYSVSEKRNFRRQGRRRATWLVLRREAKRTEAEAQQLAQLRAQSAEVAEAIDPAQDFATLVRQRQPTQLDPWLTRATASTLEALRRFHRIV